MQVFGWSLFVIGSVISILGGVVGLDVGFDTSIANLPSLLLGTSLMVSGSIFVGTDCIVNSFRTELITVIGLPERKLPKVQEREVSVYVGGMKAGKGKRWFFHDRSFTSFEEAKKAEEEYRRKYGR